MILTKVRFVHPIAMPGGRTVTATAGDSFSDACEVEMLEFPFVRVRHKPSGGERWTTIFNIIDSNPPVMEAAKADAESVPPKTD